MFSTYRRESRDEADFALRNLFVENFHYGELCCHHCGVFYLDPEACKKLQALRYAMGEALRITSGTRCAEHNRAVGGAKRSYHLVGQAFDIVAPKLDRSWRNRLIAGAGKVGFKGIGEYDSFIHVDTRYVEVSANRAHTSWVQFTDFPDE